MYQEPPPSTPLGAMRVTDQYLNSFTPIFSQPSLRSYPCRVTQDEEESEHDTFPFFFFVFRCRRHYARERGGKRYSFVALNWRRGYCSNELICGEKFENGVGFISSDPGVPSGSGSVQRAFFRMQKSRVLGRVVDYFYRVKFQERGSPHIHKTPVFFPLRWQLGFQ